MVPVRVVEELGHHRVPVGAGQRQVGLGAGDAGPPRVVPRVVPVAVGVVRLVGGLGAVVACSVLVGVDVVARRGVAGRGPAGREGDLTAPTGLRVLALEDGALVVLAELVLPHEHLAGHGVHQHHVRRVGGTVGLDLPGGPRTLRRPHGDQLGRHGCAVVVGHRQRVLERDGAVLGAEPTGTLRRVVRRDGVGHQRDGLAGRQPGRVRPAGAAHEAAARQQHATLAVDRHQSGAAEHVSSRADLLVAQEGRAGAGVAHRQAERVDLLRGQPELALLSLEVGARDRVRCVVAGLGQGAVVGDVQDAGRPGLAVAAVLVRQARLAGLARGRVLLLLDHRRRRPRRRWAQCHERHGDAQRHGGHRGHGQACGHDRVHTSNPRCWNSPPDHQPRGLCPDGSSAARVTAIAHLD